MRGLVIECLKWLTPICLILLLFYAYTPQHYDYNFHFNNHGEQDYPSFVAFSTYILAMFVGRFWGIFILNIMASVVLPYLIILAIFKNSKHPEWAEKAGIIYLYGSGVPFALFFTWTVPQSIIQVLALLSVFDPLFLIIFAYLGFYTHREWVLAFACTLVFVLGVHYARWWKK